MEKNGGDKQEEVRAAILADRVRVGELRIAPKGDGPTAARYIAKDFRDCPWNVDVTGGIGASIHDHAKQVLHIDSHEVSFSSSPPSRLPEEPYCENVRAALYIRASMLVNRGLADVPDDPILREEVMAAELVHGTRTAEVQENGRTIKKRMPSVRILDKDEIRKKIGRSPDRADSFVLSLWGVPAPRSAGIVNLGWLA